MKIHYDGQLLTTTLTVCYRGKPLQITDIIIDTGSSHTVFSPDVLEEIGVTYENGDPVYEAYGIGGTVPFYTKVMDYIQIDTLNVEQVVGAAQGNKRDCFQSRSCHFWSPNSKWLMVDSSVVHRKLVQTDTKETMKLEE